MHWKEGGNDNDTHKDKYKDKDKDRDIDKDNLLKRPIICYIFKRVGSSRISMVTSWVSDKNRDSTSRDVCAPQGVECFPIYSEFFSHKKNRRISMTVQKSADGNTLQGLNIEGKKSQSSTV